MSQVTGNTLHQEGEGVSIQSPLSALAGGYRLQREAQDLPLKTL